MVKYLLAFGSLLVACCVMAAELTPSAPAQRQAVSTPPVDTGKGVSLTLDDAVALTLRYNPAIRSLYLQRLLDKFDLQVVRDGFAPQWSLRATYGQQRNQQGTQQQAEVTPGVALLTPYGTRLDLAWSQQHALADNTPRQRRDGINLMLVQPLLRGAGRDVNLAPLRQAEIDEQMNQLALKASVSQTISATVQAYHDLLRAQEEKRLSAEALMRAQHQMEVNQALVRAGRLAEMELLQNEIQIASQQISLEAAENGRISSERALQRLMGVDTASHILAGDTPQAIQSKIDMKQALAVAESQEPNYLATLLTRQRTALALLLAKDNQRWSLNLQLGSEQQRHFARTDGTKHEWQHYAGLELQIPLNDRSAQQQRLQAEVAIKINDITLQEAKQDLAQRIEEAVSALHTHWRQYEIAGRAVSLASRNLALEREKLNAGRSSNFQLISTESSLRDAQNHRLNALIGYLNARTALDLAMGMTLESWDVELNDE